MDLIFHEKQEGSLCAQHALNALLQGPIFTPVDLATLAQKMDDEERNFMAESGVDSEEYRLFLQQPSGNMDDSGFFSVQVICSALAVWSLELVSLPSSEPLAVEAAENPQGQNAYICNYREHWFTVRKIGRQWFNLNSLLSGPELISSTYLAIFLAQLQQEGYSIFIVNGRLPPCPAEESLLQNPATPQPRRPPPSLEPIRNSSSDPDLEKAIRMSIAQQDEDDPGLAAVLRVSMEADAAGDPSLNEAIRQSLQRPLLQPPPLNHIQLVAPTSKAEFVVPISPASLLGGGENDDALLTEAIRLSLEGHDQSKTSRLMASEGRSDTQVEEPQPPLRCPASAASLPAPRGRNDPDLEEIRRLRLAYLEKRKT